MCFYGGRHERLLLVKVEVAGTRKLKNVFLYQRYFAATNEQKTGDGSQVYTENRTIYTTAALHMQYP